MVNVKPNYAFIDSQNLNLSVLLVPNQKKFSALLKHDIFKPHTRFVSDLRFKIEYSQKKKSPRKDETLKGKSSVGDSKNIPHHKHNVNKKK